MIKLVLGTDNRTDISEISILGTTVEPLSKLQPFINDLEMSGKWNTLKTNVYSFNCDVSKLDETRINNYYKGCSFMGISNSEGILPSPVTLNLTVRTSTDIFITFDKDTGVYPKEIYVNGTNYINNGSVFIIPSEVVTPDVPMEIVFEVLNLGNSLLKIESIITNLFVTFTTDREIDYLTINQQLGGSDTDISTMITSSVASIKVLQEYCDYTSYLNSHLFRKGILAVLSRNDTVIYTGKLDTLSLNNVDNNTTVTIDLIDDVYIVENNNITIPINTYRAYNILEIIIDFLGITLAEGFYSYLQSIVFERFQYSGDVYELLNNFLKVVMCNGYLNAANELVLVKVEDTA